MGSIAQYVILNMATALVSVFVAFSSWRRRNRPGGFSLFFLMLAVAQWAFFSAFEIAAITIPHKIFWSQVAYLGTLSAPVLFLIFTLDFTGEKRWLQQKRIALLFIVPTLTFLMAITNDLHGLIWTSFTPNPVNARILDYGHGIVFWIGIAGYAYLCILVGSLILLRSAIRLRSTYRMQSVAMLVAAIIPIAGNIFYFLRLSRLQGIDPTPISFALGGIVSAYAIFRYGMLDLVPIARDILIENMGDGVIVLDKHNRIADVNPSALQLLGQPLEDLIGVDINRAQDPRISWLRDAEASKHKEMAWGESEDLILDIHITKLGEKRCASNGRLIVLRDITDRKCIELKLQQANDRLRAQLQEINQLKDDLSEQVIRDPLTGLYNRRFLTDVLSRELAKAGRTQMPVSLVMLDIDHFKCFNDTYGHNAGDEVLRVLGRVMLAHTRQGDFACRYGGEEFVVIMPGAPLNAAYRRAEEWRIHFSQMELEIGGEYLQNTFSAGVATFPDHGKNMDLLLSTADRALYKAKDSGRNCTIAEGYKVENTGPN